jgi:hypothetical protein
VLELEPCGASSHTGPRRGFILASQFVPRTNHLMEIALLDIIAGTASRSDEPMGEVTLSARQGTIG